MYRCWFSGRNGRRARALGLGQRERVRTDRRLRWMGQIVNCPQEFIECPILIRGRPKVDREPATQVCRECGIEIAATKHWNELRSKIAALKQLGSNDVP